MTKITTVTLKKKNNLKVYMFYMFVFGEHRFSFDDHKFYKSKTEAYYKAEKFIPAK